MEEKRKLRIRKLTPRECLRLMSFTDDEIDKAEELVEQKILGQNMLYHVAGDSIIVDVLSSIFGELL